MATKDECKGEVQLLFDLLKIFFGIDMSLIIKDKINQDIMQESQQNKTKTNSIINAASNNNDIGTKYDDFCIQLSDLFKNIIVSISKIC